MSDDESPFIVQTGDENKPKKHKSKKHRKDNIAKGGAELNSDISKTTEDDLDETGVYFGGLISKKYFWISIAVFVVIVLFVIALNAYNENMSDGAKGGTQNNKKKKTDDADEDEDGENKPPPFDVAEEVHELRQLQDRLLNEN